MGMVKNGWGFTDHGTLKPGAPHKWFDELSRWIEWFLHADSYLFFIYSNNIWLYFVSLTSKS